MKLLIQTLESRTIVSWLKGHQHATAFSVRVAEKNDLGKQNSMQL